MNAAALQRGAWAAVSNEIGSWWVWQGLAS